MSGGVRARPLGFLILWLGVGALGCATVSETRRERVIGTEYEDLGHRPVPGLDRTSASASLSVREIRVRVSRSPRCWASSRETKVVEVTVGREPRAGWLLAGAAVTGLGLIAHRAIGSNLYSIGLLVVGPGMLVGAGATVSNDTHVERRRGRRTTELGRCPPSPSVPHRVRLELADGRSVAAITGPDGSAVLRLPEDLDPSIQGLDADLYVDDRLVRRVRFAQEEP